MKSTVLRVDAFTNTQGKGNPAGVVLNGDSYSVEQMQEIAREVGFNETVFVCSSDRAAIKLRYFTPGHETPLCGHATIGAIFALFNKKGSCQLEIETGAGILPIIYEEETQRITMKQAQPQFIDFKGDRSALCQSLGINLEDLHADWPIQYGNTGSWTLLVPVIAPEVLDKMIPNPTVFPDILKEIPKSSIHPFAVVSKGEAVYTARHFSSPFSGTTEDSVTGTASGVMGAYLLNHVYENDHSKMIQVNQGQHVQREGKVLVHIVKADNGDHEISISGTACLNHSFEVMIKQKRTE